MQRRVKIQFQIYGNIIIFGDLVSSKGGKKSFYKKPKSDTDLLKTFPRLRNSKVIVYKKVNVFVNENSFPSALLGSQ